MYGKQQKDLKRRVRFSIAIFVMVLLVVTAMFSWVVVVQIDSRMRRELRLQTETAAKSIDINNIKNLTATHADLESADYIQLCEQLRVIRFANYKCRYSYLMGLKSDKSVFFFVDSQNDLIEDSPPADPGEIYADASEELRGVFESKESFVEGPLPDEWGVWVSALVPLVDLQTDEVVAVLGIDIDAGDWNLKVASRATMPIILGVGLFISIGILLLAYTQYYSLKKVKESLLTAHENLRTIFDNIPAGVAIIDRNRKIQWINQKTCELADVASVDEIEGKNCGEYLCPACQNECPILDKKQEVDNSERILRRKDGVEIPILKWVREIKLDGNDLLLEIFIDIRYQKKAQEEILRTKKLFDQLSDHSRTMTWEVDIHGMYTYVGHVCRKLVGYEPDELVGKKYFYDLWPKNERDKLKKAAFDIFACHEVFKDMENCIETKSGEIIWVSTNGIPVFDKDGNLTGYKGSDTDITERKGAEEKLEQSKEQYRSLVNNIPGITYRCAFDSDWTMLYMSSAVSSLTGYSTSDFINNAVRSYESIIHRDDRENVRQNVKEAIESGEQWEIEYRIIHKDGSVRWVYEKGKGVFGEDGEIEYLDGFILNITDRKRAEDTLRESKQRYDFALKGAELGTWDWNVPSGKMILNSRWAEMLGYEREEISPHINSWKELLHPEDISFVMEEINNHLEGHSPVFEVEYRMRHKSGEWVWVADRGKVFECDEDGKAIRLVGTHLDITERKEAEKQQSVYMAELKLAKETALSMMEDLDRAKQQSELAKLSVDKENAKLTAMISGMDEGIIFADVNNKIIEVNDYFCRFVKTPREEIVGKKIEDLHQGKILEHIQKLINNFRDNVNSAPFIIQREIGGAELILRMQPIYRDNRYDGVLFNTVDVTELVQARKEAERAQKETEKINRYLELETKRANDMAVEAERANLSKSEFLANMSHEIRTPMNAIIGFSDLLADEDLTESQRTDVNTIRKSSKNLLNLINDILDFSKIEAGQLSMEKIDCSLGSILNFIESMMKPLADKKSLNFEIIEGDSLPSKIRSDSTRLNQCLINLINNAIKFTNHGHVYVKVSLEDRNGQSYLRFDIEDTGIGIAKDKYESIFGAFTQADGSTTRKYGGTGLGLTITKQLSELLGGELSLVSEIDKGSTFSLVIPTGVEVSKQQLLDRYNMKEILKSEDDKLEHFKFSGDCLVAEDVAANQIVIKRMLEKTGVTVTVVDDGKEAVEYASNKSFDLIFMDMHMPNMNGYEATELLRKSGNTLPIVALTANAMKGDDEKCFKAGCDDYMAKPIDRKRLFEMLEKYLPTSQVKEDSVVDDIDAVKNEVDALSQSICDVAESFEPAIDWSELMVRMDDDEELIKEVVGVWLEESPAQILELEESVKSQRPKEISLIAHAIKGSAATISGNGLAKAAFELEIAGKEGNLENAETMLGNIHREFEKLKSFLSQSRCVEIAKQREDKKEYGRYDG